MDEKLEKEIKATFLSGLIFGLETAIKILNQQMELSEDKLKDLLK